jgi:hypothetical protein
VTPGRAPRIGRRQLLAGAAAMLATMTTRTAAGQRPLAATWPADVLAGVRRELHMAFSTISAIRHAPRLGRPSAVHPTPVIYAESRAATRLVAHAIRRIEHPDPFVTVDLARIVPAAVPTRLDAALEATAGGLPGPDRSVAGRAPAPDAREAAADGSRVYLVGAVLMRAVTEPGREPERDVVRVLDSWLVPVPLLAMAGDDATTRPARFGALRTLSTLKCATCSASASASA